jgi:hypothetical protein
LDKLKSLIRGPFLKVDATLSSQRLGSSEYDFTSLPTGADITVEALGQIGNDVFLRCADKWISNGLGIGYCSVHTCVTATAKRNDCWEVVSQDIGNT